MKPVLLSKFRPNKANIARMWGEVNSIHKSTDKRVSWYSCSGHGGYIANPADFTPEELAKLGKFAQGNYTVEAGVVKDRITGELYVIGASYEHSKPRKYRFSGRFEFVEWKKIPMMVFEEDCDWEVLLYKLGIDDANWEKSGYTKEQRIESARNSVAYWHPELL